MHKQSLNTKGFGLTGVLAVVLVLVVVVGGGVLVYQHNHKAKPVSDNSSTTSTTTKTATADPYAGWQKASLQYEKVSFKYPSSWQLSNTSKDEQATGGTANPGADTAVLTGPNGLVVSLESGVAGVGDTDGIDSVLPGAQPLNTLGGSYYLDSYAHNPDSTTVAQGACLDKSASASGIPYLTSKNIQLAGVNTPAANLFCIKYKNVAVEQQDLSLENDASYNDAKLILESLAY